MKEFPPFRLDVANQSLLRRLDPGGDERVRLTPKAFSALRLLVEHAGRLVTQDELLDVVWPGVVVQPQVVKACILEIRNALGDDARAPTFIETLPKLGYRFMARIDDSAADPATPDAALLSRFVGRDGELGDMRSFMRRAALGERQIVFVTGEPGIGKTALADVFTWHAVEDVPGLRIARGQCVEGYGGKEAYYPMLEALGQLCRGPGREHVVATLESQAPTWLVQFPSLVQPEHRETLQREIQGATRERMLREIGEALETLSADAPLLLLFEDLQWVDHSTVDLLAALARGRRPARLMLVALYRSIDLVLSAHPLKQVAQELRIHQLAAQIHLEPLSEGDVADFLAAVSAGARLPAGLSGLFHRHSDGNPLFMVAALDHLTQRGLIDRDSDGWKLLLPLEEISLEVPENVRQMIEVQIDRLSTEEQQALEAASVMGIAFWVAFDRTASNPDPVALEDIYEKLVRQRHFVRRTAPQELSDGSILERYEFVHALYREVLYRRQVPSRKARRHRQIAEMLEMLFAGHPREIASQLAHHAEQGSDWPRAVKYLRLAADNALERFAHREAAAVMQHALELSVKLPEDEGGQSEVGILEKLAFIYAASYDPRAIESYEALASRAAYWGLTEVELWARIGMAYPLSWVDVDKGLEGLDRALRLSARQSRGLLLARTRASCHFLRVWTGGWNDTDITAFREAIAEVTATAERPVLAWHLVEEALLQLVSTEYRQTHREATENLAILLRERPAENPYLSLSIAVWATQLLRPWSLTLVGDWGEARREFRSSIALMEKNGEHYRADTLRLYEAWLHLFAMDWEGVRKLCAAAFAPPESAAPSGVLSAFPEEVRISQILSGSAMLGIGHHDEALELLSTARVDMDRQHVIIDWYWRMQLELSLTDLWLAMGDLVQARAQADGLLERTGATAERTFQALAWDASARVAMAQGEAGRAGECVARAIATMEDFEVPLAHWRVHATAADVLRRAGDEAASRHHRECSRETLLGLANSLSHHDPLRGIFLASSAVSIVWTGG